MWKLGSELPVLAAAKDPCSDEILFSEVTRDMSVLSFSTSDGFRPDLAAEDLSFCMNSLCGGSAENIHVKYS